MSLTVLAYNVLRRSATATDGTATVTFPEVPSGYLWRVTQMTVECETSEQVPATIYDAGDVAVPCSGTSNGNLDFDDDCSIVIPGGSSLQIVWGPGCDPGATASARVQFELCTVAGKAAAQPVLG